MAHTVLDLDDEGTYDIEEPCPECGTMNAIRLDYGEPALEVKCANCGKGMMLCSACDANCDWVRGNGCCKDYKHIGLKM